MISCIIEPLWITVVGIHSPWEPLVLLHVQVIESTSTMDGAVAVCLLRDGDKEGKSLQRIQNQHMVVTVCTTQTVNDFCDL